MDADKFIHLLTQQKFYSGQISHIEPIPSWPASFKEVDGGIDSRLATVLAHQKISKLYTHQALAIESIRAGSDTVVVSGTASGKTVCYMVPSVEEILKNQESTMLYLYPTKALTQDQLRGLQSLENRDAGVNFFAGVYDGDTGSSQRKKVRDNSNIVLTNPDMLHQGILPQHARWGRFFENLKYIVIDELHCYRGIFGSHLANVLRRLTRISEHHGSRPVYICCSATIANPGDHASWLCGRSVTVIDNDGAPKGAKRFVFWNPPVIDSVAKGKAVLLSTGGNRRSSLAEAVNLMSLFMRENVQTIAFVKTRIASELLFKQTREQLSKSDPHLAGLVHAYRGGYLPSERRVIEQRLASRDILGIASTSALELGIDIGSLDASILVGYPGSIASLWQQAGRAGRSYGESIVVLIAQNAPVDQYLMAHSNYLFSRNPEHAVIDPDNPHITVGHIRCASNELPLSQADAALFGVCAAPILDLLEEDHEVRKIRDRWFWASSVAPAPEVNLRTLAGPVYAIQEDLAVPKVIGMIDELSAHTQLHDHAVYLHGGETYFVDKLDSNLKIAFVQKKELDYYTYAVSNSNIAIETTSKEQSSSSVTLGFSDVTVTTTVPTFKKIRFHSREVIGYEPLDLPTQQLETVSMWFYPSTDVIARMVKQGYILSEALIGIASLLIDVVPLHILCDSSDIGSLVDTSSFGVGTIFIYDKYPGGMGYARRCMAQFPLLLSVAHKIIKECGCDSGCPSCVGASPNPSLKAESLSGKFPSKAGASLLLELFLR